MVKELVEKRKRLHEENIALLAKVQKDGRELMSAEEEQEWQARDQAIEALGKNIEMRIKQDAIEARLAEVEPRKTAPAAEPEPRSGPAAIRYARRGQEEAARGLRLWLLGAATSGYYYPSEDRSLLDRLGIEPASKTLEVQLSTQPMRSLLEADRRGWEYRAQGLGTGAAGAFAVPDELMRALEVALLAFGGMRQRCTILRTSTGAALPIPTVNDTGNVGALLAENTQVSNQDVAFAQLVLDAYKYSSKQVLVSAELLQDNAINIGAYLGEALGTRIGRITNTHFTTGTGSGQPNGIVTAAPTGFTAPNGDGQVTTWKYTSIVELEHSVDPAYRANAAFMMADSSVKKTKLILDSTGRPLWAPGIAGGAPDTLMGYPIVVNQDVAAMALSAKSVLFGDLSKYLIRDVLGITLLRLDERYADFHQVAFLAFARMDGDLLNAGTGPVKVFVNAAS
jgi:HK97 family phage major capsid protein